jgi:hypothetical protein
MSDITFLSAVQIHNHKASGYHSWYTYEVTGQGNLGFEFGLEKEIFLFSKTSRPTPEHDQPSIQCIPGFFLGGKSDHAMKLTIHLVLRLRTSRALSLPSLYGFVAWREKNEHLTAQLGMCYQHFRGPYYICLQNIRGWRKYPSKMLIPM